MVTVDRPLGPSQCIVPLVTVDRPLGASQCIVPLVTVDRPLGASQCIVPLATVDRPLGMSQCVGPLVTVDRPLGAVRFQVGCDRLVGELHCSINLPPMVTLPLPREKKATKANRECRWVSRRPRSQDRCFAGTRGGGFRCLTLTYIRSSFLPLSGWFEMSIFSQRLLKIYDNSKEDS